MSVTEAIKKKEIQDDLFKVLEKVDEAKKYVAYIYTDEEPANKISIELDEAREILWNVIMRA